jgi:hypothetical protein
MTVRLPRQAAYGLARAAGAKVGNTVGGHVRVTYPLLNAPREYIYGLPRRVPGTVGRSWDQLETDLVSYAEQVLGIAITKTPLTEAQEAALADLTPLPVD